MSKHVLTTPLNSILSDKFIEFKNGVSKNFSDYINMEEQNLPDTFEGFSYPVCAWPILISKKEAKEIAKLSIEIPRLIRKIPELYFEGNVKKIADFYFEGNELFTELALTSHTKNVETSVRLDLIRSKDAFKVLEVNTGSNIGGWEIQVFESIIRKSHPLLSKAETIGNYKSPDILLNYIRFLIDKMQEKIPSSSDTFNLFLRLNVGGDPAQTEAALEFFNSIYTVELERRGYKGKTYGGDPDTLKLRKGKLCLNEEVIHGLAFVQQNTTGLSRDIFRAFLMNKIYLADHPGVPIYGDKRNLGLLRELAEMQKFSPEENELILASVPWTKRVIDEEVIFENQRILLINLLKNNREKFVIKLATGAQGEDVFIGKFSTLEEWEEIIQNALEKKNFIVQEFCDSMDLLAPNRKNEWIPHKLIWGSFGYGKNYGGVWVRMSEVGASNGVINSATGAVDAIVFETS